MDGNAHEPRTITPRLVLEVHGVAYVIAPCHLSDAERTLSVRSPPGVLAGLAGAESVAKIIGRTDGHTRHGRVGMLGHQIRPHARKFSSGAAQNRADGACLVGEGGRTCGRHLHQGRLRSHWLPGANRAVAGRLELSASPGGVYRWPSRPPGGAERRSRSDWRHRPPQRRNHRSRLLLVG